MTLKSDSFLEPIFDIMSPADNMIRGFTIESSNDFGIEIEGGKATIEGNTISSYYEDGIFIVGGTATILRNKILMYPGMLNAGIIIRDGSQVTVEENQFTGQGTSVIHVLASWATITGNTITLDGHDGISISENSTVTITKNTINIEYEAIRVDSSTVTVENNTITTTPTFYNVIDINKKSTVTFISNQIYQNRCCSSTEPVVTLDGTATFQDNRITVSGAIGTYSQRNHFLLWLDGHLNLTGGNVLSGAAGNISIECSKIGALTMSGNNSIDGQIVDCF